MTAYYLTIHLLDKVFYISYICKMKLRKECNLLEMSVG